MSNIGEEGYKIFNLKTQKSSKKTWKTYRGAIKNCGKDEMVCREKDIIENVKREERGTMT